VDEVKCRCPRNISTAHPFPDRRHRLKSNRAETAALLGKRRSVFINECGAIDREAADSAMFGS
jgi:hypothetical protein